MAQIKFLSDYAKHIWLNKNCIKINSEGKLVLTKREEDLGFDLYTVDININLLGPGQSFVFKTGIAVEVPNSIGLIIKERGSTGIKQMTVQAGVIDSNYRGEIMVIITNSSNIPLIIGPQEDIESCRLRGTFNTYFIEKAICQLVPIPRYHFDFTFTNELSSSDRGEGRLGSTGQ